MEKKLKRKIIRKLKKFFLYNRSFIKMICFSIVLVLILILGNSFGYVSADDTGYLLNQTDYQSSSYYDASIYCQWFGGNISQNSAISYDYFVNTFDYTEYNNSSFDASSIKYYMAFGKPYPTKDYVYLFPDDAFIFVNTPYTYSWCLMSKSDTIYRASVSAWGDGTNLDHLLISNDDSIDTITITSTTSYTINGETWYYTTFGDSNHFPILGNCPYYSFYQSVPFDSYPTYMVDYLTSGTHDDVIKDINYLSDSVVLPGFENMEGSSGGSGSGETSENNLYLRDSKWNFSIPKWSNLTGYSGNATFSASLNDFQQENLSDFYLEFSFTIHTQQSYVNSHYVPSDGGSSGGGHGTEIYDASALSTGYLSAIFKYVDSSTGNDHVQVSLQDFYNQGSSKAFMTLNGIFDRCFKTGFSGSTSSTSFVSWYNEAVSSSQYTTTKAILYCYATLYDSGGNASGNCVYYYDLLNGTSGVTDSSMSINDNPYVDEDGNIEGSTPEDSNGNNITNNNSNSGVNVTQTVNVNNDSSDSKSWLWTLITSLLTSGNDELTISEAGMSDTLVTLVGINPWISLMSTTFGFVPATVWVTLSAAFVIVLGILVVAFILRIVLDLL